MVKNGGNMWNKVGRGGRGGRACFCGFFGKNIIFRNMRTYILVARFLMRKIYKILKSAKKECYPRTLSTTPSTDVFIGEMLIR